MHNDVKRKDHKACEIVTLVLFHMPLEKIEILNSLKDNSINN
jgi:hypothetical protein